MEEVHNQLNKEVLAAISEGRVKNYNEAQTRFHILDRVIFELLGWSKDETEIEERTSEDGKNLFIDYTLTTA